MDSCQATKGAQSLNWTRHRRSLSNHERLFVHGTFIPPSTYLYQHFPLGLFFFFFNFLKRTPYNFSSHRDQPVLAGIQATCTSGSRLKPHHWQLLGHAGFARRNAALQRRRQGREPASRKTRLVALETCLPRASERRLACTGSARAVRAI